MTPSSGSDATDPIVPTVRSGVPDLGAGRQRGVGDQPAERAVHLPAVLGARDRLLAQVAALGEVDRAVLEADLLHERLGRGIGPDTGDARADPDALEPRRCRRACSRVAPRAQPGRRTRRSRCRESTPARRPPPPAGGAGAATTSCGELSGPRISRSSEKWNRSRSSTSACGGLGVGDEREAGLGVTHDLQLHADVALGVQQQRQPALADGEVGHAAGHQAVQEAGGVGSLDPHQPAGADRTGARGGRGRCAAASLNRAGPCRWWARARRQGGRARPRPARDRARG